MSRVMEGYITDPRTNVISVTGNYTTTTNDGSINVDAQTAEITIAPVYNVGKRLLIRKLHATTGDINILLSGSEVVTKASLTSLKLQTNGDFWLLEKVATNRWELLEGYESLNTTALSFLKEYNGNLIEKRESLVNATTPPGTSLTLNFNVVNFVSVLNRNAQVNLLTAPNGGGDELYNIVVLNSTNTILVFNQGVIPSDTHFSFSVGSFTSASYSSAATVIGKWY